MIETLALDIRRGGRPLVAGLDVAVAAGEILVLAGPNGTGKSSLIATLAGDIAPASGRIRLAGRPLAALSVAEQGRLRAVLPQRPSIAFPFPVHEVVAMGLHPHGLSPHGAMGARCLGRAMEAMELGEMAGRPASALSGGEQQRVHLARALAQAMAGLALGGQAAILLDEPTTGLDYRHQSRLEAVLRALAGEGAAILASLHDLSLAARLADRLLLLAHGRAQACGAPDEVLTHARLAHCFGLTEIEASRHLGARPQHLALAATSGP
jgi:iron complex transport system ATP-binding protein